MKSAYIYDFEEPLKEIQLKIDGLKATFKDFQDLFGTKFKSGSGTYTFLTSIAAYNYFNNGGDSLNMSTEAMWDALLTQGYRIYGVSSDDAHYFENIGRDISNPGKGWVMVNAPQLDAMHITQAMVEGKFYASNGVILNTYDNSSIGTYMVDIDINKTSEIISALNLWGKCVIQGEPGFRVEFIGSNGEIISSVNTTKAAFNSTKHYKYIRAKIVYTVVDNTAECTMREYYAWVQPVFSSP